MALAPSKSVPAMSWVWSNRMKFSCRSCARARPRRLHQPTPLLRRAKYPCLCQPGPIARLLRQTFSTTCFYYCCCCCLELGFARHDQVKVDAGNGDGKNDQAGFDNHHNVSLLVK